jgi:Cu-Zn family superoxide dismutase
MRRIASLVMVVALLATGSIAYADGDTLQTTFEVRNANGQSVGTVTLTQQSDGVRVQGTFSNLPSGTHGIHFHAVGACTPDFAAAGPHFNPAGRQHGFDNPQGAHAGDLPNLEVAADGTGTFHYVNDDITLQQDEDTSVYDADGTALVIHANADDYVTDPSGNSGDRIACGVVSPAEAVMLPDTGSTSTTTSLLAVAVVALLAGLLITRRTRAYR